MIIKNNKQHIYYVLCIILSWNHRIRVAALNIVNNKTMCTGAVNSFSRIFHLNSCHIVTEKLIKEQTCKHRCGGKTEIFKNSGPERSRALTLSADLKPVRSSESSSLLRFLSCSPSSLLFLSVSRLGLWHTQPVVVVVVGGFQV